MTDLSPCPCCDGPAAFGNPPLGHQIYCLSMKCGTQSGIFPTKPMARNAWSKRASPAATPTNDRHYLSAIRKRLEQLYDASAGNPRLREQLSDEVDWVDEQLVPRPKKNAHSDSSQQHSAQGE